MQTGVDRESPQRHDVMPSRHRFSQQANQAPERAKLISPIRQMLSVAWSIEWLKCRGQVLAPTWVGLSTKNDQISVPRNPAAAYVNVRGDCF